MPLICIKQMLLLGIVLAQLDVKHQGLGYETS